MAHISNESVAKLFPFRTKETMLKKINSIKQDALGLLLWFTLKSIISMKYFYLKPEIRMSFVQQGQRQKAQWCNVTF